MPRLGIDGDVSFLVDTGADHSYLMPADAKLLGIDHAALAPGSRFAVGIGGVTTTFAERTVLAFGDGRDMYVYDIVLSISPPGEQVDSVPSLLGRDILDRWSMSYSPTEGRLAFEVLTADAIVPSDDHEMAPRIVWQ